MVSRIRLKTLDGQPVEFIDQVIGSGAMKDVYFSYHSTGMSILRHPVQGQIACAHSLILPAKKGSTSQIIIA